MTSIANQATNYGKARAALAKRAAALPGFALFAAAIVATALIEGIL